MQRVIEKPAYGSACNGCGKCCQNELCPLGAAVFRHERGPCPALETADGRFFCGLVENPQLYSPIRAAVVGRERLARAAKLLIGAGEGCDAKYVGEPENPRYRARVVAVAMRQLPKVGRAKAAWGFA
jgi:hypothetical protein